MRVIVQCTYCCVLMCYQIGISPGMTAAYLGHHYAGPGNHFCECAAQLFGLMLLHRDRERTIVSIVLVTF